MELQRSNERLRTVEPAVSWKRGWLVLSLAAVTGLASLAGASAIEILFTGIWTEKHHAVEGNWAIASDKGVEFVQLHADFLTEPGPDLKIFLSPRSIAELEDGNATLGSLEVATLEQYQGKQRFEIPEGVDLYAYKSIVIHCEKYSKMWAVAELAPR